MPVAHAPCQEGNRLRLHKEPRTPTRFPVSEANITKAAMRLLSQKLVSYEVQYIKRTLGSTATQEEIDSNVLAVRKMPLSSLVVAE